MSIHLVTFFSNISISSPSFICMASLLLKHLTSPTYLLFLCTKKQNKYISGSYFTYKSLITNKSNTPSVMTFPPSISEHTIISKKISINLSFIESIYRIKAFFCSYQQWPNSNNVIIIMTVIWIGQFIRCPLILIRFIPST